MSSGTLSAQEPDIGAEQAIRETHNAWFDALLAEDAGALEWRRVHGASAATVVRRSRLSGGRSADNAQTD